MPQRFRFEINEEGVWTISHEAILNAQRCLGYTKTGHRCQRKCVIGFEYCSTHLESIKKLKIKNSTLPNAGKGLFVSDKSKGPNDIVFKKNDKIVEYNGKIKTQEQLDEEYGNYTAPYAMNIRGTENVIDAGDKRGVGSLINHKSRTQSNCKFKDTRQNHRTVGVEIVATKSIRNGQELFVSYGDDYIIEDENEVRHSTKPYYPPKRK